MSHSYQSLQGKTSREAVSAVSEEPDTSNEDISANATFNDLWRRNWYSRLVLDWWLWEIGACALSLLALAATIAVLVVYSEKNVPELPKYITFNAIISVLANAIRVSILVVIAACISQLKWLWMKDMRRLQDLQIFDDASRGPLGSLHMLFYLRGSHLASLGAVITILAVALEPFMQQLIVYPVRLVYRESGKASILRTDNVSYAAQGQNGFRMDASLDKGIMNAIYNGDSAPSLEPFCSTGNCTWPVFHSIGVCSRCVDMVDQVKLEGASSYIAWLLNYKLDDPTVLLASTPYIDGNFAGVNNPLFALGWLEIDYSSLTNTTPISRAMECMFTYCLQRYDVSVESGVSTIKTEPVHLASMNQLSGWNVTAPLLPDKDKERTTTFVVDDSAGHSLWKSLILDLVGNATTWVESTEYFIPSNTFIGTARAVNDKVHMMESIAQSVTYSILEPSNQTMTGLVGLPEQFMHVRWGWIALPTFIVLAAILCLCLVMMCTKRHNVKMWKSSSLALLYHGFGKPVEDDGRRFTRLSDMTHNAANSRARLAPSGNYTWELQVSEGGVVDRAR
ncbi:conserved hypothetical protein [Histoplasma capsulatum var. duboisii H88]|uniref:Uncharacterized protein n=1 Tax=Ajellomyces capsulatus (strain H88) TaxID=544711 RepID=F0U5N0_AJEC8|nr:conserved hypothetical protein [Histoplasma capsulatum var. duboisii H88]